MSSLLLEVARVEVRKRRAALGLSQLELAEFARVHVNTIKNIEGAKHQTTIVSIERVATALGCHACDLLFPAQAATQAPAAANGCGGAKTGDAAKRGRR